MTVEENMLFEELRKATDRVLYGDVPLTLPIVYSQCFKVEYNIEEKES